MYILRRGLQTLYAWAVGEFFPRYHQLDVVRKFEADIIDWNVSDGCRVSNKHDCLYFHESFSHRHLHFISVLFSS